MISKELKNDFREMIFGTFVAAFEDLIYSWEKNISFGNGHFQKLVEIIFHAGRLKVKYGNQPGIQ